MTTEYSIDGFTYAGWDVSKYSLRAVDIAEGYQDLLEHILDNEDLHDKTADKVRDHIENMKRIQEETAPDLKAEMLASEDIEAAREFIQELLPRDLEIRTCMTDPTHIVIGARDTEAAKKYNFI